MRNQLGAQLLERDTEFVVDDEPVLLSTSAEIGRKAVGTGLPSLGWLVLTNERFVFASLEDKATTEVRLDQPRVTHVEDGWVTMSWKARRGPEALSIGFMPKSRIQAPILSRLVPDKVWQGVGQATPGRPSIRDRFTKVLPRRRPGVRG